MTRTLITIALLTQVFAASGAPAATTVDFASLGVGSADITSATNPAGLSLSGITFLYDNGGDAVDDFGNPATAQVGGSGVSGSTYGALLLFLDAPATTLTFDFSLVGSAEAPEDPLFAIFQSGGNNVATMSVTANFVPYDAAQPQLGGDASGSLAYNGATFDQVTLYFSLDAPSFALSNLSYESAAPVAPALQVTPSNQNVTASAGTTSFDVTNTGGGTLTWSAQVAAADAGWLHITAGDSGTDAGTISVSYDANAGAAARTGTITVTATGAQASPQNVTVTQAAPVLPPPPAPDPVLQVTPSNRDVAVDAGATSFAVANTGGGTLNWSAQVAAADAGWLHITAGASGTNTGTISVSFDANAGSASRTGTITVTAAGAQASPQIVTVTQAAPIPVPALQVTPSTRDVTADAGTTSFGVANSSGGTLNWSAQVAAADVGWLHITAGASGTNTGTINVSYDANAGAAARTGTITVTATGAQASPRNVTVTQVAPAPGPAPVPGLQVTPSNRDVTAAAGATSFDVANNSGGTLNWSAQVTAADAGWLHFSSGTSGTDTGTINVSYDANAGTASRTGTITVTAAGAQGSPQTVTVTQAAAPVQYTLSVEIGGSGPGKPAPSLYAAGTWATLTAAAAPSGSHFTGWSGDIGDANSTDETISVLMDRDRTITANYAADSLSPRACGFGVGSANMVGFYALCWVGLSGVKLLKRRTGNQY